MATVEIIPSAAFLAAEFASAGIALKSFKEPLKRSIQQVIAPGIRHAFEVEGIPPWAPLKPETLTIKESLGYPADILIREGKLKKRATQLNAWTINTQSAIFENLGDASYGYFHLEHTKWMPVRDFLSSIDSDIDQVTDVFGNWVEERFTRRGFAPGFSGLSSGFTQLASAASRVANTLSDNAFASSDNG